jgi:hypothetical protein
VNDIRPRKPDFFIVGAPRCGTTALYSYLRQHPDVFLPEYKEPHYFNIDMAGDGAIRDEQAYLNLFAAAQAEKRVGEASVYYLSSKAAAHAIKAFSPAAKIIIMLRDPVEVMYALHAHHLAAWLEDVWDFETAMSLEADRQRGLCLPAHNKDPHRLFYRHTVRFAQHVRNYRNVFGSENVHVIIYDDFKDDSAHAFRQTCSFLGVDPNLPIDFPVIWSNPGFRSPTLARLLQHPPRFARAAGRILLPRKLRSRLVGTLWMWNSIRAPRPPMPFDVRKRLTAQLTPEVEELSALLGRDLSQWSVIPSSLVSGSAKAA